MTVSAGGSRKGSSVTLSSLIAEVEALPDSSRGTATGASSSDVVRIRCFKIHSRRDLGCAVYRVVTQMCVPSGLYPVF